MARSIRPGDNIRANGTSQKCTRPGIPPDAGGILRGCPLLGGAICPNVVSRVGSDLNPGITESVSLLCCLCFYLWHFLVVDALLVMKPMNIASNDSDSVEAGG